jgi:peptide chain release factor 3
VHRFNNLSDVQNPELEKIRTKPADTLREELELIDEVYPKFDRQDYLDGKLQLFFPLNNFGVRELLDCFVEIAITATERIRNRIVDPKKKKCLDLF